MRCQRCGFQEEYKAHLPVQEFEDLPTTMRVVINTMTGRHDFVADPVDIALVNLMKNIQYLVDEGTLPPSAMEHPAMVMARESLGLDTK